MNPLRWAAGKFIRYAMRMNISAKLTDMLKGAFHHTNPTDHPKPTAAMRLNKGWLFAANRQIGGRGARVEAKLYMNQHSIERRSIERKQIFNHPFLDLLDSPNPDETGLAVHWRQLIQLNSIGRTYLLVWPEVIKLPGKLKSTILTKIRGILLLAPDRTRPITGAGPTREGVRAYEFTPHGQSERVLYRCAPVTPGEREEWRREPYPFVVRAVMPAADSADGQAPAVAADAALNINFALNTLHQNQLINGLHAGLIFYMLKDVSDPERFEKSVIMIKQGLGKAGEPMILPKKVAEVAESPVKNADMQFGELHKTSRQEILAVAGASDGVVGLVSDVNRANLEGLELGLAIGTIDPLNDILASAYNRYILPLFGGQSDRSWLTVEFSSSALVDEKLEADVISTLTGKKPILTQNEGRGRLNMPPEPGGDNLKSPTPAPLAPPPAGEPPDRSRQVAGVNLLRLLPKSHPLSSVDGRQKKWRQLDATRHDREDALQEDLIRFWQRWGESWERLVKDHGVGGAILALGGVEGRQDALDFDEWKRLLHDIHGKHYEASYVEAWVDQMRGLGLPTEMVDADRARLEQDASRAGFDFTTHTMQTQVDEIERVLLDSRDDLTEEAAAALVLGLFPSKEKPRRSTTQAMTVIGMALSIGAWRSVERQTNTTSAELGLMWLSERDGKVRDSHTDADGQVVRATELFQVGDCLMRYPIDTEMCRDPGETINCRCLPVAVQL